jgi:hypothetical protein
MSDPKTDAIRIKRFDRPSETLAMKNTLHAPWLEDDTRNANDKSQHRRYHSLYEDMMN